MSKTRFFLVVNLCFFANVYAVGQTYTYCFKDYCHQELALVEAKMQAESGKLGVNLVFDYMDQTSKNTIRYYKLPTVIAHYLDTTTFEQDIPETYYLLGVNCGGATVTVKESEAGWQYRNWVSGIAGKGVLSRKYAKDVSVSVGFSVKKKINTWPPQWPPQFVCQDKSFVDNLTFDKTKYENFTCHPGYSITYVSAAEKDLPVCQSDLTQLVYVYSSDKSLEVEHIAAVDDKLMP